MNTEQLTKKREALVSRFNQIVSQLETVEKSIQKGLSDKELLVANLNAFKGAIELVDELLKENEPVELKVVE